MNDASDGRVSMFDGFYRAVLKDDTFETDYILITGLVSGDLRIMIKAGQAIWPQWIGKDLAEDLEGNRYFLIDGEWIPEAEVTETEDEMEEEPAAS